MPFTIRELNYYYATVIDQPGEGYRLLTTLADLGINLEAFTAFPTGPTRTQLAIFPSDSKKLESEARKANLQLDGPHPALLVQGDDHLGALAQIHERLFQTGVNVYAANGVTDGEDSFGYVLYIRPEELERAKSALEI